MDLVQYTQSTRYICGGNKSEVATNDLHTYVWSEGERFVFRQLGHEAVASVRRRTVAPSTVRYVLPIQAYGWPAVSIVHY